MIPDDDQVLEHVRSEHRPSAATLAVISALRVLQRDGRPFTLAALAELTGYGKSQLHTARAWLDAHAHGWRDENDGGGGLDAAPVVAAPESPAEVASPAEVPSPAPVEPLELLPATPPAPRLLALGRAPTNGNGTHAEVEVVEPAPPPALWRSALAEAMLATVGRKSWDAYTDLYSPAADAVLEAGQLGDLIALTVDYLESITGESIDSDQRKRVAQLVRSHGKAALYGLREALPRVENVVPEDYLRYATVVCQQTVAKKRSQEANA